MRRLWQEWSIAAGCMLAASIGAPGLGTYWAYIGTLAAWRAIMAVGYDVLLGYTGFLSMAHGTLFGVGAYACAVLTTRAQLSFWLALPAACLLAAAIGALVGMVSFRAKGFYFAVLTLGLGLIGYQLFTIADITGGIQGFVGIPSPPPLKFWHIRPPQYAFWLSMAGLFVTYLAASLFVRAPLGGACKAVREDATLARALGMRVGLARMCAFTFSAFFAGGAGALFAAISNYIGPESFAVMGAGFDVVVVVVVGGMGTLWGPVLGAALLTIVPELLRAARTYSLLGYGVLLLLFILFAPKGIAGMLAGQARAGLWRAALQRRGRAAAVRQ